MYRKELLVLSVACAAIFCTVASGTYLAVNVIQRDARRIAEDSLPGIVSSGEAIEQMHRNWLITTQLISVANADERIRLMNQIETNSGEPIWDSYERAIYDPEDARLFQDLLQSQGVFLSIRAKYFQLIQDSQVTEASTLLDEQLSMAFDAYLSAANNTFRYNALRGMERSKRILDSSKWTPYLLGFISVGIFLFGMVIGFKTSLGAFSPAVVDDVYLNTNR